MFSNPLDLFGSLAGIGVLSAGLGFAYSQIKIGANKAKDDLIITLKDTAAVERAKADRLTEEKNTLVQSHQVQLNELNKQMGILQGKAEETTKKLEEYREILQGRSPEQSEFMHFMITSAKETSEILKEVKDELKILSPRKRKAFTQVNVSNV